LSRTAAHEASFDGVMLRPYFLSNPFTFAITTEAQSVSGMKPILRSFFSGASDPAAQTVARIAGVIAATRAAVPAMNLRRGTIGFDMAYPFSLACPWNEKGVAACANRSRAVTPLPGAAPSLARPSAVPNARDVPRRECALSHCFC
jgi:hypothetical protein